MADKWDKYAVPATDEWDQYATEPMAGSVPVSTLRRARAEIAGQPGQLEGATPRLREAAGIPEGPPEPRLGVAEAMIGTPRSGWRTQIEGTAPPPEPVRGIGRGLKNLAGMVTGPVETALAPPTSWPEFGAALTGPGGLYFHRTAQAALEKGQEALGFARRGDIPGAVAGGIEAATGLPTERLLRTAGADLPGAVAEMATTAAGVAALGRYGGRAIGKGAAATKRLAPPTANLLRRTAETNIERVLGATTKKLKVIASEKVVPGILDRNIKATTLQGLSEQAAQGVAEHGGAVEAAVKQATDSGARLDTAPIIDRLEGLKSHPDYTLTSKETGKVTAHREAPVNQIQEVQDIVAKYGPTITPEDLVAVRRFLDDAVAKKKMAFLVDETKGFEAHAQEAATNVLRDVLNSKFPDLAAANNEFSFYRNLQTVVDATIQRRASQSHDVRRGLKLVRGGGIGGAVGAWVGGYPGAAAGSIVGGVAEALHDSPFYRTRAAGVENRLASSLGRRPVGRAMGPVPGPPVSNPPFALGRATRSAGSPAAPARETTPVSPATVSRQRDIAAIEQGGGKFVGLQNGVAGRVPDMYMFNDPQTGSTLSVPTGEATAEAVASRIADSRAKFQNPQPSAVVARDVQTAKASPRMANELQQLRTEGDAIARDRTLSDEARSAKLIEVGRRYVELLAQAGGQGRTPK